MAAAAARFDDTSNTAGPFIKFGNLVGDSWTGSILFMTRNDTTPPSAKLYVRSNPSSSVRRRLEPKLLDTCHGWRFWRFEVAVTLCPEETAVDYEVTATGLVKKATFWVQASGKPFHVGYTSCNGISLSIPAGHYARQGPRGASSSPVCLQSPGAFISYSSFIPQRRLPPRTSSSSGSIRTSPMAITR